MTTHKDRPHHIDCQSKYFSETPEFPGQRLRCTCGEGTRDVYCAWSSDFAGLQGIATFFARLQPAVAARHYYDGWNYRELPDNEYPLIEIEDALYASPVTPAAYPFLVTVPSGDVYAPSGESWKEIAQAAQTVAVPDEIETLRKDVTTALDVLAKRTKECEEWKAAAGRFDANNIELRARIKELEAAQPVAVPDGLRAVVVAHIADLRKCASEIRKSDVADLFAATAVEFDAACDELEVALSAPATPAKVEDGLVPVCFQGVNPLDITGGAFHPMLRDSWRFGFFERDGKLFFGYQDNGPLVAYDAVTPDQSAVPDGYAIVPVEHYKADATNAREFSLISSPDGDEFVFSWALFNGSILTRTEIKMSAEGFAHTMQVLGEVARAPLSSAQPAKVDDSLSAFLAECSVSQDIDGIDYIDLQVDRGVYQSAMLSAAQAKEGKP